MVKKGDRFLHRHWLAPGTNQPAEFEITAIRRGTVYYGDPGTHKAEFHADLATFERKYVLRWTHRAPRGPR